MFNVFFVEFTKFSAILVIFLIDNSLLLSNLNKAGYKIIHIRVNFRIGC